MADAAPWMLVTRADPRAAALADRHYSRRSPGAEQFSPPGAVVVLLTTDARAVWVSLHQRREYVDHRWPGAWLCSLFRNEGAGLSSALISAALAATVAEWGPPPPEGLITFIDAEKVRAKRDPGRCFRRAGFEEIARTADRGLVVLRLGPERFPAPAAAVGAQLPLLPQEAAA